jgi:curli biogenesis system outer membrane secretion channel CsgG
MIIGRFALAFAVALAGVSLLAAGPNLAQTAPTAPKKRIAVLKFDAGGAAAQAGGVDLGSGLAAQLTTALVNSGRFIVVERPELAAVLREQELVVQKLVGGEATVQPGQMIGAQLLVRATVTTFEQKQSGSGVRLGAGVGVGVGSLGVVNNTGVIGIDMRVIDAMSGQVVQSHHLESKIESRGFSGDIGVKNASFGGDAFERTPLGLATRQVIEDAVAFVVASSQSVPWSGRVVEVNGDEVIVNAGSHDGIKSGDRFAVSTIARRLTDPASGAVIGVIEQPLGEIAVVDAQPGFSIARMAAPFTTKRGDLVKFSVR